ncbi:Rrf2 family transcriptional regulator [Deinococcus hopiensis]|uniref:Transcriptional regulator, BadM/Rrf2 family n=1 Tax=Deinococcus hopiensis KR-140 TaxID=695939 RepID=A0A1W1UQ93_9DEIO|nr:Rrf2 family transcriptional regulator [Deinococcus hopiensis]SMB83267.1 transcriptional regulator, BadM/Rrf2 family [Deinococcus hopiensis KR-140]
MRLSSLDVHAFQAVGYLAAHPDRWVNAGEICQRTGLSRTFLVRVLACLVRGEIVLSKRGTSGGYRLALPASDITLRDVVRLLERPVAPLSCVSLSSPTQCDQASSCRIRRDVYEELRQATHLLLSRFTAADLALDLLAGVTYERCLQHLWHPTVESGAVLPLALSSPPRLQQNEW